MARQSPPIASETLSSKRSSVSRVALMPMAWSATEPRRVVALHFDPLQGSTLPYSTLPYTTLHAPRYITRHPPAFTPSSQFSLAHSVGPPVPAVPIPWRRARLYFVTRLRCGSPESVSLIRPSWKHCFGAKVSFYCLVQPLEPQTSFYGLLQRPAAGCILRGSSQVLGISTIGIRSPRWQME